MKALAGIGIAGVALASVPYLGLPPFYESFLYLILHWIALATSWNILSGYSGYFSFGHGAFFGAGMYTTATLAARFGVPFLWTLPIASLVPMLLGVALGAVVFRVREVRGELFALVTLAVTFVVGTIILNTPIDGGPGVYLNAVPIPTLGPTASSSIYLLGLAIALTTVIAAYAVYRSRLGAALFAIHDDEDVAEVLGVPTFGCKMVAFALSCALAGAAGGVYALFVSYVTVGETFSIVVPLTVVLMSVLGGSRHWAGPAVGAAIITCLLYAFTAGNHPVAGKAVFGFVLIGVILFMPDGVLGSLLARLRKRDRIVGRPGAGREHAQAALEVVFAHDVGDAVAAAALGVPSGSAARGAGIGVSVAFPTPDEPRGGTAASALAAESRYVGDRSIAPRSSALLLARGIRKSFRGVRALDGVDLEIRRGEILGLLGPNGSGKSTLINLVSGHYRADGGGLLFDGRDIAHLPAHRIARIGIARTYQIPRPFGHLSVLDNVTLPAMFGAAALPHAAAVREARRWLEFTGLGQKTDALPAALNLHQRKFLELARALAARPRLVLLDEVLSGLTPGEINEAIALIRRIRDDGATIVFVEHVMRAVMALTDRIIVLNHGQVIAEGPPDEVMEQQAVVTAFLGPVHA